MAARLDRRGGARMHVAGPLQVMSSLLSMTYDATLWARQLS